MSGMDLFFWSVQIASVICVAVHFGLAFQGRSGPVARLLLLGPGCLMPLVFALLLVRGSNTPIQSGVMLVTILTPGSWLILVATVGLIVDAGSRDRVPSPITMGLVALSCLGVAANLVFAAIWSTTTLGAML